MHMGQLALAPALQAAAAPSLDEVVAALRRVPAGLRETARKSTDTSIDERAVNVPSDIAGVREIATGFEGGEIAAGGSTLNIVPRLDPWPSSYVLSRDLWRCASKRPASPRISTRELFGHTAQQFELQNTFSRLFSVVYTL